MRGAFVLLVIGAVLILMGAPSHKQVPALPEPGARRIVAAVFGASE